MENNKQKITVLGLVWLLFVVSFVIADIGSWEANTSQSCSFNSTLDVVEWNKTYGGLGDDWATGIVQTIDGGYAIAGYTYSFGAGFSDFWLVKADAFGNMEWNKTYGGTGEEGNTIFGVSIIQASDGGFVLVGHTDSLGAGNSDFWLVKVGAFGNMQWNKTYGGSLYDYATSVVETSDGGYAVVGATFSFGAGRYDYWLVKTDNLGNMEWNRTYGGIEDDFASAIIKTADGGFAIAGFTLSYGANPESTGDFWLVKTDAYGNVSWSQTYGGLDYDGELAIGWTWDISVIQTADGFLLTGPTRSFGNGFSDFWLVKANTYGKMQWSQAYGGLTHEFVGSIVSMSYGYVIAGLTNSFGSGATDVWLIETDSSGVLLRNATYGGVGDDYAHSIIRTTDGGVAIAGYTDSFGAGAGDFWLIKLRSTVMPYLPTDLNRDGTVDILDLTQVGQAYGSNLTLAQETNKTVVTVLSFDKSPPEVENARVAIVDPTTIDDQNDNPIPVGFTNSSGIVVFRLGPNKNYTAVAWGETNYNYANFTTNSLGEASILIILGEPTNPIKYLPSGWVMITLLDNETGQINHELLGIIVQEFAWNLTGHTWYWIATRDGFTGTFGVVLLRTWCLVNKPHSNMGIYVIDPYGNDRGSCVYSPDENGCANVILYVTPPP